MPAISALPDEEFDYDEFVKEEFGTGRAKPRGIHWLWWLTAAGRSFVSVPDFSVLH